MVVIITGESHTGKTALSQSLLERYHYPYFSIDHLKMGLIRSGQTHLTPEDDDLLTQYLWPIVVEMIKTAIENEQNLIVEGLYVPGNWKNSFSEEYLNHIRYVCLVFSDRYIRTHYDDIVSYADVIEKRLFDESEKEDMIADNRKRLEECKKYSNPYVLIDEKYEIDIRLD